MASYQQPKKLDLDDLDTLCDELHSVRRRWYNIGLQLQLPATDLQHIESKHRHHSSCLRWMLKKWLELGSASWETLCAVLRLVGDSRKLAADLLEKYCGKESDDPEAKRRRVESGHTSIIKGKPKGKPTTSVPLEVMSSFTRGDSYSSSFTIAPTFHPPPTQCIISIDSGSGSVPSQSPQPVGRSEAQPTSPQLTPAGGRRIASFSSYTGDLKPLPERKNRPQQIHHYFSYSSPEPKSKTLKFSTAKVTSLPSAPFEFSEHKLISTLRLAGTSTKPAQATIGAPATYDPFFATSQTSEIRGAEMSASTTVIITDSKQSFMWKEYGLKLHVLDECLPPDIDQCKITIMVSIAGQYDFPENCHPVSAIFWLRCELRCNFRKPVTLEVDHCAKRENTSKLHFVKAVCNQKNLPYTFQKLKEGIFNQHTSYGTVELHSFSGIGVVQENSTEIEREYCAMLFYLGKTVKYEFHIHFVVTWDTKAHLSIVKEDYQEKQALSGHTQPIDFESDQIRLDIPMSGVTSEGWTISPLFPPVIIKKKVDNFESGKMIPSCQLNAAFASSKESEVPSLKYCVKLLGAKKPYDMFNIIPSTTAATITKKKENVSDDTKPKLRDLLTELLTKVASKWENIGIMLDLEQGQLNTVKADHGSDSESYLRGMLQVWLSQVEPLPTWSAMAQAIENVGHPDLAKHLRTKYCESS